MITKTLQGVIRITEINDYYLVLPNNGMRAQNGLAIQNIEEVYIIVEQIIGGVSGLNFYLPKISEFNGGWNAKIHFLNKNESFGIGSYPYVNSYADPIEINSDFINVFGQTSYQLAQYQLYHIVDNNFWGILGN